MKTNLTARAQFERYLTEAKSGDAYAQSWVGYAYDQGIGVAPDQSEAFKWHKSAAKKNDTYSENWLAWAFYYGRGAKQSHIESFKWNYKTALKGDPLGQYNVGNAYSEGAGIKKDAKLAVMWWRRAAKQEFLEAICNLGMAYEDGVGVKKSVAEARSLYQLAARKGDVIARFNLARFALAKGPPSRAQARFKLILPELRALGRKGDAAALLCLGDCATFGWGMRRDGAKGRKWYARAGQM
jgi:TPR repeat protein